MIGPPAVEPACLGRKCRPTPPRGELFPNRNGNFSDSLLRRNENFRTINHTRNGNGVVVRAQFYCLALLSLCGCSDLMPFSLPNSDRPAPTERIDQACAQQAKIRAQDASYYLRNHDEDAQREVYQAAYADCLAWKKSHGQ
jgi:predicted small lipoprotein YifL